MGAFRSARHRAFRDTWKIFGGWSAVMPIACVPPVGFALHWLFAAEAGAVMDEITIWAIYGLAAAGLIFLVIFLWNFACAPYRNEHDNFLEQSRLNTQLKQELDSFRDKRTIAERMGRLAHGINEFSIAFASRRPSPRDKLNYFDQALPMPFPVDNPNITVVRGLSVGQNTDSAQIRLVVALQDAQKSYDDQKMLEFNQLHGVEFSFLVEYARKNQLLEQD